jgi:PAS domain S-box-containing protein
LQPKTYTEQNNFHANLLDHIGQAVMMVDTNRKISFWNAASEKLFGWTKNQAIGQDVVEVLAGSNTRDDLESIAKWLNAQEAITTEYLAQRKDGSLVPILVNRSSVYDDKGVCLGSALSATDITEQKIIEKDMTVALEYLSANIDKIEELNEKLKVVGSLTRHDVRNKLSSVTGYTYILKKRHYDLTDLVEGLDKMSQAVTDSMKIFEIASTYEQVGMEALVDVDVGKAVDGAVEMFPGLPFKVVNDCHGLIVHADSLLRQLLFNFIDNTRKYGKTTKNVWVHFKETASGDLQLIYEDDGVGIPEEYKKQLFRQGFSTGGSTGFGLFLSKKIVHVYGWSISEDGEVGKGTRLVMTISKC